MRNHLTRRVTSAATALAVVVPATAAIGAPPPRDFARTFPSAARLCERADAGKLRGALKGKDAQVEAACAQLRTAFANASTLNGRARRLALNAARQAFWGQVAAIANGTAEVPPPDPPIYTN
ncbi:MAG: hypothetical protein HZB46_16070 [Solirubrobacterales bacterium]|nr:hypothetical protein [Solirubrobacterales bacterium]